MTEQPDRRRVLELVYRYGWNSTAFQTLESGFRYFFPSADACVAYVDTGPAWVAAGAPLAPARSLASSASAFVEGARAAGKRACFFGTEDRLVRQTRVTLEALPIGVQPVYDPLTWTTTLSGRASLREQLRRARSKGVSVRQLTAAELESAPMRAAIRALMRGWADTRGLATMDFLVRVEPFGFSAHRRCFGAELSGNLIAFANLVPVPARGGWLLEDLLRDPAAPNGTSELLIDAALRAAAHDGSRYLTLGLAPLSGDVPRALRLARMTSGFLYDFDGVRAFKHKFGPSAWSSIYLSHPRSQSAATSLVDALSAFAGGSFVRFGLRSLRHRVTRLRA